jgi:cobalt-zinc-cadmium efflux system membrane fusion protein
MKITSLLLAVLLAATVDVTLAQKEPGHADEEHAEEAGTGLQLDPAAREEAGIVVAPAAIRPMRETVQVPGEVTANAYRSAKITPRISAQIVARKVTLGDVVAEGQPLVTLSSVEVAEAQGALLVAEQEWQRVQELGREVVSESRYVQAQVAHQQAHARLLAYGMSEAEIETLKKKADTTRATGRFDLVAPQAGRVIFDDFVIGDFIEPGRVLFELSDESELWVEASLAPGDAAHIRQGAEVDILHDSMRLPGKVLQVHHRLDEATRRQSVRITVDNSEDLLHPGEFVEVSLPVGSGKPTLAVPAAAVVLVDGGPTVFRLHEGTFEPVGLETGEPTGDWVPVLAGVEEGDVIAVEGAFHLKSLLLKSELGSGHAH